MTTDVSPPRPLFWILLYYYRRVAFYFRLYDEHDRSTINLRIKRSVNIYEMRILRVLWDRLLCPHDKNIKYNFIYYIAQFPFGP